MMDVYLVLTVVFVFVCSIALGVSESIEMRKSKRDFLKYDSDYSGDLDKDEMRVLLTDLKIESTEKVLKMIFDKFDKNLSDSIDFDVNWISISTDGFRFDFDFDFEFVMAA